MVRTLAAPVGAVIHEAVLSVSKVYLEHEADDPDCSGMSLEVQALQYQRKTLLPRACMQIQRLGSYRMPVGFVVMRVECWNAGKGFFVDTPEESNTWKEKSAWPLCLSIPFHSY